MFSSKRAYPALARANMAPGVAIGVAVLIGGCSADVTRFDFPFFGLTEKSGATGSLPTPSESMTRRSYEDLASGAPRGAGLGESGRSAAPAPVASTPGGADR